MKKQVIVALALAIGLFSNAQKNELKAAEKAIKSNNYAEAKSAIMSAESLIGAADDKTKAKFYILKSKALYANGAGSNEDQDAAVESIAKAASLNNSKYKSDIEELQINMLNTFLTKANSKLQSKQYKLSSFDFERAYKMSPKDTLYLYYAASTAVNGQDYDRSLEFYESLRDMGFTGAGIEYTAINKETGVEETFDNRTLRDAQVTIGTHMSPKEKKKKTKSAEIIKNIALIYLQNDETEKAMTAMSEARSANPNDMGLILTEANVRLKMGEMDKFKALMEEATKMDPENAELQYNLGVIAADSGDKKAAKAYYEKAIALDPNYGDAYTNMAVLILDKEQAIVEEMNSLGTSAADDKKYDELREKRKDIYKQAIPILQKSLSLSPKNTDIMQTLANIYSSIGETDKYKEMKAKIESIQSGN
ncbi:tetratricopeptide repeat protein [Ichthyenterobacterium sp. W332]|uniref:Tetratricopeptide repeat protein n=1 Tax=Microcosmobacter mediterraneus TaxID=3075607 RepID=A0ABU2YHE4_9FLAO|nr:tetratricopeptide repeat protein [Ichthyenterobacterium sp. W332]MDT0557589.1 tetratricopeptide repeat protein [Ichthyenterobacterium sp. W332]